MRWLTPRTFRLWRDVGIDGYTTEGLRDEAFRGRTALRNKAMVELLYGSGLRVQEAGSLLVTEVPPPGPAGAFNEAHLPASIAKGGRSRVFYVLDDALALVNSYIATSRRVAVERARKSGRYKDVLTVEVTDMQVTTASVKFRYNDAWHHHDNIEIAVRTSMFINTEDGCEPLWLWLNEAGLPMLKDTWTDVFDTANDRVTAISIAPAKREPSIEMCELHGSVHTACGIPSPCTCSSLCTGRSMRDSGPVGQWTTTKNGIGRPGKSFVTCWATGVSPPPGNATLLL